MHAYPVSLGDGLNEICDHRPKWYASFVLRRPARDLRVARGSGTVPDPIEAMVRDSINFIVALGLGSVDVLGHSMGGLVAQE